MFMTWSYGQFYEHMRTEQLNLLFISAQTSAKSWIKWITVNANYI